MWVFGLAFGWLVGSGIAGEPSRVAAEAEEPAPSADGGLFGGKSPIEAAEEKLEEMKTAEQLAAEQRLAEYQASNADKLARVVVLRWDDDKSKGKVVDYENETLRRNIKNRIARTNAKFFPEVDLYQAGRVEPDEMVRPADQRAVVPATIIPRIVAAVEDVSAIPFDGLSEQDWLTKARELEKLLDEVWFVDRAELREPLFLLYSQLGRAAENTNQNSPPYYQGVDGKPVNYYFYLAGTLAYRDSTLLAKLTDQDVYQSVSYYKDQVDSGVFRPMVLSFDLNNVFDAEKFLGEYQVFVNGVEEVVKDPKGRLEVPMGRADVYLKRADGHSLSDRIEHTELPDKFDFVRQNAVKRMGIDFIEQLTEHPNDCMPQLSGDIVNFLTIYAKLHPAEDIFISIPFAGSVSPGRILLWRWDRPTNSLFLVQDNTGGFPVRFAATLGAGLAFSGVDLTPPETEELTNAVGANPPPTGTGAAAEAVPRENLVKATPTVDGVPIYYQLRGHYNHLMAGVQLQYKVGTNPTESGSPQYVDLYQTDGNQVFSPSDTCPTLPETTGTTGGGLTTLPGCYEPAFRERELQRLVSMMFGFTIGKDAAVGFGPKVYLQLGWYNAPHAADVTGHVGYAAKGPDNEKDEERMGRVRPVIDFDLFGGVLAPFVDSRYIETQRSFFTVGKPILTFGFTAGVGLTF